MMQRLMYLLIIAILLVDFATDAFRPMKRVGGLLPELLSIIAVLMIVGWFGYAKRIRIHPKYLILFVIFGLHVVAGMIANDVQPGAVIAGLRNYFKFLPFFLLPAVYWFSDQEIHRQLRLITVLALVQLPVVLFQRFVFYEDVESGDSITGTLNISSELSIFLIACIAVWFAFHLRGRISSYVFYIILCIMFLPTTLNETKGTLILLPIALAVPAFLVSKQEGRLASLVPMALVGVVGMAIFAGLYTFALGGKDRSVIDYYMEGRFADQLYRGAEGELPFDGEEDVGRVDTYVLALKKLSETPLNLLVGLGAGNVADSFHPWLAGEFTEPLAHMRPNRTAVATLLWELGLVGVCLIVAGAWLVYGDSRRVRQQMDFAGTFAVGWSAVVILYLVSLTYKNIVSWNVIGYFFFYFSGYVASRSVALQRARELW